MQDAFGYVLFGVVIVGAIVALITLIGTGAAYKQIGRGGMSLNEDGEWRANRTSSTSAPQASAAERELEIRQLLEAKNARRAARGQATVDVDEEMARLDRPAVDVDPALQAEIRDMVIARNERRVRRGKEPLDVEAEVARQLGELA